MPRNWRREDQSDVSIPPPSAVQSALLDNIDLELLGERLRRARLERKITQRSLVEGLFTSAYLSSLELGKTRPTYSTLYHLSLRLDKSVDYFLRESSGLIKELDQEQLSILNMRLRLLTAQTTLATVATESALSILDNLTPNLKRLNQTDQANYHYLRARYYNLEANPTLAISELFRARELLEDQTQPELAILVEKELGTAYFLAQRVRLAISQYELCLEKLAKLDQQVLASANLRAKLFDCLGQCYLALDDQAQALISFEKALEGIDSRAEFLAQADGYYQQAQREAEQGDFLRASLNLGRTLGLYEEQSRWQLLLNHNLLVAELLVQAYRYDEAEFQLGEAQKASQLLQSTDRCLEIRGLVTLGIILQGKGQFDNAKAPLMEALSLSEQCEDVSELGRLYQTLAQVESELENRASAEEYYKRAFAILESSGLQKELAELYHNYGQQQRKWGEANLAFEYIEKAYELKARSIQKPIAEITRPTSCT